MRSPSGLISWHGLALLALVFASTAAAQDPLAPSLAVSTSRLEIELDPARPQAFDSLTVLNVGAEPQAILVSMNNWDLDDANQFRVQPPSPQSLDQWLVVNPVRFTLAPGGSQTIRFAIRPRVTPEPGEHRAMVFFNQDPDAEINANRSIVFNLGVPIYAYVGDYWRTTAIEALRFEPGDDNQGALVIEASNSGNAHSRAEGFFGYFKRDHFPGPEAALELLRDEARIRADGQTAGLIYYGRLNSVALLPGTARTISTPLATPAESGTHYLVVSGRFGDAEIARIFEI